MVAVIACVVGMIVWPLRLLYGRTEAQRYLSQIGVRDYQRVYDYVDPGRAPAKDRAAVAVFVGPPDVNVLARVSGPGLVVRARRNEDDGPGLDPTSARWVLTDSSTLGADGLEAQLTA